MKEITGLLLVSGFQRQNNYIPESQTCYDTQVEADTTIYMLGVGQYYALASSHEKSVAGVQKMQSEVKMCRRRRVLS